MEFLTEAVEVCPNCEGENVYPNWDVTRQGFVAKCQHCGWEIMLCDECLHAEDNLGGKCDWVGNIIPGKFSYGSCFRGSPHNDAKTAQGICLHCLT